MSKSNNNKKKHSKLHNNKKNCKFLSNTYIEQNNSLINPFSTVINNNNINIDDIKSENIRNSNPLSFYKDYYIKKNNTIIESIQSKSNIHNNINNINDTNTNKLNIKENKTDVNATSINNHLIALNNYKKNKLNIFSQLIKEGKILIRKVYIDEIINNRISSSIISESSNIRLVENSPYKLSKILEQYNFSFSIRDYEQICKYLNFNNLEIIHNDRLSFSSQSYSSNINKSNNDNNANYNNHNTVNKRLNKNNLLKCVINSTFFTKCNNNNNISHNYQDFMSVYKTVTCIVELMNYNYYIIVSYSEGSIMLWDIANSYILQVYKDNSYIGYDSNTAKVHELIIIKDNNFAASYENNCIKVWNIYMVNPIMTINTFFPVLKMTNLYKFNSNLFLYSVTNKIVIFDIEKGKSLDRIYFNIEPYYSLLSSLESNKNKTSTIEKENSSINKLIRFYPNHILYIDAIDNKDFLISDIQPNNIILMWEIIIKKCNKKNTEVKNNNIKIELIRIFNYKGGIIRKIISIGKRINFATIDDISIKIYNINYSEVIMRFDNINNNVIYNIIYCNKFFINNTSYEVLISYSDDMKLRIIDINKNAFIKELLSAKKIDYICPITSLNKFSLLLTEDNSSKLYYLDKLSNIFTNCK